MKLMTPEFWITLLANLFGVAAVLGLLTPEQATQLTASGGQIAGALIAALSTLGFLRGRAQVKAAAIGAVLGASGGVSAMSTTGPDMRNLKATLKELGLD